MWRMVFLLIMGVVPGVWAHGDHSFEAYPRLDYYNSGLRAADDPDDIELQLVITNPPTGHTVMLYGIDGWEVPKTHLEKVTKVWGETTYKKVKNFRLEPGVTLDLSPPKYRLVLEDVPKAEDGLVGIVIHFGAPIGDVGLRIPYPTEVMKLNMDRPDPTPAGK